MMIINRTKEIVESQGLTIQALAEKAGVAYGTAHGIYSGSSKRIDLEVLDKICAALNVQPGDLLVRESEKI